MLARTEFIAVFCQNFIVCACASLCTNYTDVVKEDSCMDRRMFHKIKVSSVYDCASLCLVSSACASFNFDLITLTCDLNSENSSNADVGNRRGFVFSDIYHWPKALTGPCSTVSCPNTFACNVDRRGVTSCVKEFQGCGIPPLPQGSMVTYDGHYLHAVAEYACARDFKSCRDRFSRCLSNAHWDDMSGLCFQTIWTNQNGTLDLKIPCGPVSEMMISMNVTLMSAMVKYSVDVLSGSDILLHVGTSNNHIHLNSRINKEWGAKSIHRAPLVPNKNFKMVITFNGDSVVEVDGIESGTLYERDPGGQPSDISIYGAFLIHELQIMTT